MTWKCMMLIVLVLNTLDLSKAGCANYFYIEEWPSIQITIENLTQTIPVVKAPTLYDSMKCTLEKEKSKRDVEHFLTDCFTREDHVQENTPCESDIIGVVPFYHFMCLMAMAVNETPPGCDYDTMWKILSTFGQTTTSAPTTTTSPPPTTTSPPPTTTSPPPTTTSPPTTPTTSATTEMRSPPTTKTLTTSATLSSSASPPMASSTTSVLTTSATTAVSKTAYNKSDEQSHLDKHTNGPTASGITMIIFAITLSLALALALVMYFLCKRLRRRRRGRSDIESNSHLMMNPTFAEVPAETEPITSGPDACGVEQRSRSIQHSAVVSCSADTNTEERRLVNGTNGIQQL